MYIGEWWESAAWICISLHGTLQSPIPILVTCAGRHVSDLCMFGPASPLRDVSWATERKALVSWGAGRDAANESAAAAALHRTIQSQYRAIWGTFRCGGGGVLNISAGICMCRPQDPQFAAQRPLFSIYVQIKCRSIRYVVRFSSLPSVSSFLPALQAPVFKPRPPLPGLRPAPRPAGHRSPTDYIIS